jgi:hypothetical protein
VPTRMKPAPKSFNAVSRRACRNSSTKIRGRSRLERRRRLRAGLPEWVFQCKCLDLHAGIEDCGATTAGPISVVRPSAMGTPRVNLRTCGSILTRRITQDDYDKKARDLKEQQAEFALLLEQHQQGDAAYRRP